MWQLTNEKMYIGIVVVISIIVLGYVSTLYIKSCVKGEIEDIKRQNKKKKKILQKKLMMEAQMSQEQQQEMESYMDPVEQQQQPKSYSQENMKDNILMRDMIDGTR